MKEIIFTTDRVLQKAFAQKVNEWAVEQLSNLMTKGASAQLTLFKMEKMREKLYQNSQGNFAGSQLDTLSQKRPQSAVSSLRPTSAGMMGRSFNKGRQNSSKDNLAQNFWSGSKQNNLMTESSKTTPRLDSGSGRPMSAVSFQKKRLDSAGNTLRTPTGQTLNKQQQLQLSQRPTTATTRPDSAIADRPESAITIGKKYSRPGMRPMSALTIQDDIEFI